MEKIKLIYIAGDGRSGSTLLDRILGEAGRITSCGEIWNCWERAFLHNQMCACNLPFENCIFWKEVVRYSNENLRKFDANTIIRIQKTIMRIRYIPFMLFPILRPQWYSILLKEYSELIVTFYCGEQNTSKCTFIVDSSKMPLYGLLLNSTGNFDMHTIHLVRDSLAVAYSWKRKVVRPEINDKKIYMPIQSNMKSSLTWMKQNILSSLLAKFSNKSMLLKYEDLMIDPKGEVEKIYKMLNLDLVSPVDSKNTVEFGMSHIISGNPMRFKRGNMKINNEKTQK